MAVASAEPYASYLHFAPEDNHASTSSVRFLRGRMHFLTPNQQRQSTEGNYMTSLQEIESNSAVRLTIKKTAPSNVALVRTSRSIGTSKHKYTLVCQTVDRVRAKMNAS